MLEAKVEDYLYDKCRANDILCYKFSSPSNNGMPDRVLIGYGQVVFVELKAPHKEPRILQRIVHDKMLSHGANVVVIDSRLEVDRLLASMMKG